MFKKSIALLLVFVVAPLSVMGAMKAEDRKSLESFGYSTGRQVFEIGGPFGLSEQERVVFMEGVTLGASGQSTPGYFQEYGEKLEGYLQERMQLRSEGKMKAPGKVDQEEQKYLRSFGYVISKQTIEMAGENYGLNGQEREVLIQGFLMGASGTPLPQHLAKSVEKAYEYMQTREAEHMKVSLERMVKDAEANKDKAKQYFAKLGRKKRVQKTESGLHYEIKKAGLDPKPTETSSVTLDYVGTLLDGTEFDSSKKRGKPATFNLGQVIPGFREGIQLIGKGGSVRLYVPSELAYGDSEMKGIPAGSVLIFDVDLIEIVKSS